MAERILWGEFLATVTSRRHFLRDLLKVMGIGLSSGLIVGTTELIARLSETDDRETDSPIDISFQLEPILATSSSPETADFLQRAQSNFQKTLDWMSSHQDVSVREIPPQITHLVRFMDTGNPRSQYVTVDLVPTSPEGNRRLVILLSIKMFTQENFSQATVQEAAVELYRAYYQWQLARADLERFQNDPDFREAIKAEAKERSITIFPGSNQ